MHGTARGALTLATALLAGLLATALCACSGLGSSTRGEDAQNTTADSDTDAEASTEEPAQIKIGTSFLEPFFYIGTDGEYAGIDAEIAKEACSRAGLEPDFVQVRWGDRDDALADGTVDCIWSAFAINGRESEYLWTDGYLDTELALLVSEHSPTSSVESFGGPGGIAVRASSIAEQVLLDGGTAVPSEVTVRAYGTAEMAETAFVKGFADGWLSYKLVLDQLVKKYPGQYRYLSEDLYTLHLGVAFARDYSGPFYRKINDALASMKQDGTLAQIVARYTGEATGSEADDAN